jgi:hypothetical protein
MPVSLAVRQSAVLVDNGLAPFAEFEGIKLATSIGCDNDNLDGSLDGVTDDLAPSLKMRVVPWSTTVVPDAAVELAVIWAAEAVGAAQRLLSLSVAYAKERKQFDKPIGSFQVVKHRLADMHSLTEYAHSAVIWGSMDTPNASRAALYALDSSISVAEGSIQVHGGMGFTWEMGLHFYMRNMLARRKLVNGLLD